MRKYEYDEYYFIMEQNGGFLDFNDIEEEEAYARVLNYGKRQ